MSEVKQAVLTAETECTLDTWIEACFTLRTAYRKACVAVGGGEFHNNIPLAELEDALQKLRTIRAQFPENENTQNQMDQLALDEEELVARLDRNKADLTRLLSNNSSNAA